MSEPLHILILEDWATDAELMLREVRKEGIEFAALRVHTENDFRRQIREFRPGLILADYSLPAYDGLSALAVARQECADVPFILVSGSLGEELAIQAIHQGATDYVLKQNLARLGSSVRRALREADEQRARTRAEASLRESQALYQSLVEQLPQCIFRKDRDGRFTFVNRRFCELIGLPSAQVLGKTDADVFPRDLAEKYREDDTQIMETGQVRTFIEPYRPPGAQSDRTVEVVKWPLRSNTEQIIGVQGIFWDISERKRTEDQLRKLARAVEQSPVSIVITDRAGNIEFVNPKFTRVSGYSLEEALGQNPRLLKSGETSAETYRELWKTILAGKEWRGEFHNKRKDGTLFWESVLISPVRDASEETVHFIAVKEDVTEKKLTEAKFLRAQRLESIGSLASGIAHDLNNILTPILMCAPPLAIEDSPETRKELAQTIESSAQRAAGIVKQLLSFARGKEGQKQPVPLHHLVREMAKIARETFPRSIQVEEACDPNLWPVRADATHLHQVLLNLCVNARDAMPDGGKLTLHGRNAMLDEHFASMHPEAKSGPYVLLEVQDSGTGIPEPAREHIFESFFTTKGEGEGTGLGLATVKGIVLDHGGFIQFRTAVGKGTTFEIYLPAAPEAAAEANAVAGDRSIPRGHGELILVVDDEAAICDTTRCTLERHGYSVLQAGDGIQALAQFSTHQPAVRAVVTDFMMPLMDGVTLCRALRALSPQTPLIVSSGGLFGKAGEEAAHAFEQTGVRHILHKPHNADVLLQTLAEVFGHSAPASGDIA